MFHPKAHDNRVPRVEPKGVGGPTVETSTERNRADDAVENQRRTAWRVIALFAGGSSWQRCAESKAQRTLGQ